MQYLGDFAEDSTVYIPFNTFSSNDPQASVTITNLADADIMVHKDGGLTQIATDGATVVINFDSITGNHLITINTSIHADYSAGSEYAVRIEGTTVDAGTINAWVGAFSIERAGGALAVTKLIQTAVITNAAGTDVAADIIAVKAETALIVADTAEIGTAGAGLTDITLNAASIDLVWDEPLTGGTHNVATSSGRRLRALQDFQGYEDGAIWVDTLNGTAGTTDYENGTVENAVLTWADALTINTSLGLNKFRIKNGSTITFTASIANMTVTGESWTLVLNGQAITNAHIAGCNSISGISSGTGYKIIDCLFGATISLDSGWIKDCRINGTITLLGINGYFFQSCFATTGTVPIIDLGAAVGAQIVCLTPLTGGVQINNMLTGDIVHIEGAGEWTLDSSCTGGTLEYAGDWRETDNSGGAVTLSAGLNTQNSKDILVDTANMQPKLGTPATDISADIAAAKVDTAAILVDTGTTIPVTLGTPAADVSADIAAVKVDTAATLVDTGTTIPGTITTLQSDTDDIQTRLPAALVGGRMDSDVEAINNDTTAADNLSKSALGILPGTCEGVPTTTVIQTDLSNTTDDSLIGRVIVFTSGNSAGEGTDITDYVGATGTVTVTALATAPAASDAFVIV